MEFEQVRKLEQEAKDYFLRGGGGFEGGEDGSRAVTFSFNGMIEMAAAFAEYKLEQT